MKGSLSVIPNETGGIIDDTMITKMVDDDGSEYANLNVCFINFV